MLETLTANFSTGTGIVYYDPSALGAAWLWLMPGHEPRTAYIIPMPGKPFSDTRPLELSIATVYIQETK